MKIGNKNYVGLLKFGTKEHMEMLYNDGLLYLNDDEQFTLSRESGTLSVAMSAAGYLEYSHLYSMASIDTVWALKMTHYQMKEFYEMSVRIGDKSISNTKAFATL